MAKYKTKKECFTTYINHQGEIFNVVNKIHIKYKKMRLSQNVLHPKSFVSNFWGAVQSLFETASFYIHLILHLIHFIRLYPYTANSPNSSSIRSNWLYFAIRSERLNEPVFIWPLLVATAISAMVASSVSPER